MVSRKPQIVGKPFRRVEGQLKVTGASQYLDDIRFGSELLHACLVRSARAHAHVVTVDTEAAEALPGVVKVLTGRDIQATMGMQLRDRPVLAVDRVRYAGEPVAAVAAESLEIARRAAALVRVEYEDLPAVFDVEAGLASDAPLVHPDLDNYERSETLAPQLGTNINNQCRIQKGDLDQGWAEADVIIEHSYRVSRVHHVAMETHGGVAQVDADGRVTLWASTQAPFFQRLIITQALGIDPGHLRVVSGCVGGAFGGKTRTSIEAIVVALALAVPDRPVKLVLSRREEFESTFTRPGLVARLKMGATNEGQLTAVQATYHWDAGASADALVEVVQASSYAGAGPYRISHSDIRCLSCYTNLPPAGPMRGNGMAEIHWALEQHIDRMAAAVGQDPLGFRLQNLLRGGDELIGGRVMHATGLHECARQATQALAWSKPSADSKHPHLARGKGLAVMWNPVLQMAKRRSEAGVRLEAENICTISVGGVDFGQGINTLAVQLVASELGIPLEWVRWLPVDTDNISAEGEPASKQLTWSIGNAVLLAALDAKQQMMALAAAAWGEEAAHLDIIDGHIISYASERQIPLTTVLAQGFETEHADDVSPLTVTGQGVFISDLLPQEDGEGSFSLPILHFSAGAQAVEVEVDMETGETQVLQVASAFDVGHAINPDIVRAQIRGGVVQGMSTALLEQMVFEKGELRNSNLQEYTIATIKDLPQQVIPIIVEIPQDDGPYGARGIGEHSLIPTAPAIANALFNAAGVRIDTLPITAENVWKALQAQVEIGGEQEISS